MSWRLLMFVVHVSDTSLRLLALVLVLAVAGVTGVLLQRRDRRVKVVDEGERLTPADVSASEFGTRATFVQFSTPVCAPCRSARRVLEGVVADQDGLRHVEVDASARLDLARRLDILRTPTVLVLDGEGRVTARLSGVPTPQQARSAAGLTDEFARS